MLQKKNGDLFSVFFYALLAVNFFRRFKLLKYLGKKISDIFYCGFGTLKTNQFLLLISSLVSLKMLRRSKRRFFCLPVSHKVKVIFYIEAAFSAAATAPCLSPSLSRAWEISSQLFFCVPAEPPALAALAAICSAARYFP